MGKGLAGTALGFAIAAFVLGWIPFLGWLIWIAGAVLAIVAFVKCKTSEQGKGMAIAAIVIFAVSLVVTLLLGFIGAMAYFGVLSPNNFLPDQCSMMDGISCMDYSVSKDGVQLSLANNLGVTIENVQVEMSGDCSGQQSFEQVENGGKMIANLCSDLPSGRFKGNITVTYFKEGESIQHTATGEVMAKIQ